MTQVKTVVEMGHGMGSLLPQTLRDVVGEQGRWRSLKQMHRLRVFLVLTTKYSRSG